MNMENEIEEILSLLDGEEYPQTVDFLSDLLNDKSHVKEKPYAIASQLMECDKSLFFPNYLINFIEKCYLEAIEKNDSDAMNDLGAQYYEGSRGFPQDFTKAFYYYNMAAEHGSRQAQENLGYCYYYGRNIPVDYEKAFHYFALGAFDGHLISLYKIGDMYLNGYYVKKNVKEAYYIYERVLDLMTDEASKVVAGPVYLRLGKMYLNGIGAEKDLTSALVCYQKAEFFLYNMVKEGNVMYKKSYQAAIDGAASARAEMQKELPKVEIRY